jgi:hypothetical protein
LDKKLAFWNSFCEEHDILDKGVPLFQCVGDKVDVFPYGNNHRIILKRSQEMETLVVNEVEKVISDFKVGSNTYEGLVYLMFWKEGNGVVPLYIGKSEKYGRKGGNLSANIENIRNNHSKFCRWGYNYDYHIGDLSAVVCEGHPENKIRSKYRKWAETLFESFPTSSPDLKRQTYFWITAWKLGDIAPWKEVGSTSLTFLEYILIGLASSIFPGTLLNEEGVNRE